MRNGKSICDLLGELAYARERQQRDELYRAVERGQLPPIAAVDQAERDQADNAALCKCLREAFAAELKSWWDKAILRPTSMRGLTGVSTFNTGKVPVGTNIVKADPTRRALLISSDLEAKLWVNAPFLPIGTGISTSTLATFGLLTDEEWGALVTAPWYVASSAFPLISFAVLSECYVPGNLRPLQ